MKKIVIYIFFIFSYLNFTGCSNFLEEDNKGGIENDEFYSTTTGYQTLITSTYSVLRELYKETPILELDGTDLYLKGYGVSSNYADYNFEANADECESLYERCYKGIQYANAGLYYIDLPDMSDGDKIVAQAELRFLRAFYHFLILEQMGGIVINTEFTDVVRLNMPRSSLQDSYDFIISEMEAVLPDLKTAALALSGQVNQDVANHYLAKVYLTKGWDIGSDADFTKAITYADAVIASKGGIQLSFADVWDPTNENNQEVIFSVQFSSISGAIADPNTDGNNQCTLYATYSGGSSGTTILRKQTSQGYLPTHAVYMNLTPNDARYQTTFMPFLLNNYYNYYTESTWANESVRMYFPRVYSDNVNFTSADTAAWEAELAAQGLTPASNIYIYPITNNETHYLEQVYGQVAGVSNKDERLPVVRKFDDLENTSGTVVYRTASMRDIVLARLAETYFLKAEALIALGSYDDAANVVQIVINRPGNKVDAAGANLPNQLIGQTTEQGALEAYLIESGLEQFGEFNGRWQLLRRTGMLRYMLQKYNTDYNGTVNIDAKYDWRPIPEDAIILNDGLTEADQNPGY
ncbi:RagB/SusD family nutrient uptake outer membrane protein [Mangrovibacterium sp.]|uniref:RagB/SusD family nutrient uptake outer membrane protein n=1 Tax=Mangrovibacterium sp. TaxID=1961364 RepID=UPI003566B494